MATKRRKVRKTRKRSCKNGKLKKPIKTKSGGKRRCKKKSRKSKKKSRRRQRRTYKMAELSDIPDEILVNIFKNSSLVELSNLYYTDERLRGIAVEIVRKRYTQKQMADDIHMIIETGDNLEVVRMLLDAGADPNYKIIDNDYYYDGLTYLIAAVYNGRPEIVRILLKYGADPNVTDDENESALQIAVSNTSEEIVKLLLEAGADRSGITKDYVFSDAMESSIWIDEARIWTMLSGERPEENIKAYDWEDLKPNFMDNWPTKVEPKKRRSAAHSPPPFLREPGPSSPELRMRLLGLSQEEKDKHLMMYVDSNDTEIVRMLIEIGADVNYQDEYGHTALMFASRDNYTEILKILLDRGADPNIQDNYGEIALMFASRHGRTEVVRMLLNAGADVNAKDNYGETALMRASASRNGRTEVVRMLINAGADPNIQNNQGKTALWWASRYGNTEVVRMLRKAAVEGCPAKDNEIQLCDNNMTPRQKKRVYLSQVRKFHPDKNPRCEEYATRKFKELGNSCNPVK